jgi:hypothetical protein
MVQLKLRRDGTVRRRITVAEGESLVVGRLTITDLSTNGTRLILQGGRRRLNLRHHTQPFTVGDEAVIVPGLEIVRSGRQYPLGTAESSPALRAAAGVFHRPAANRDPLTGPRASRGNLAGEDNGRAKKCRA